jgi:DNA-binding transcriptional MerR regulator
VSANYQIAEVARRSGFSASTLRYYEGLGLVRPVERTDAGYRLYDDRSLSRLAFIARAKQLGCTLDEITGLVDAWDGPDCAPVQTQLRELVGAKLAEAQARVAELVAFTAQLQLAAEALARRAPDGPCDDACGCMAEPAGAGPVRTAVTLTSRPATATEPPIACSLDAGAVPSRMAEWQAVLRDVVDRERIDGGYRLALAPPASVAAIAELAAAEQACCSFLCFAITVDGRGTALEVTAPAAAADVVDAMFGGPA